MKRAIIYARVSTDDQAEYGYSLPTQIKSCRQYAKDHGFTVVTELADDCSGDIPIAERPRGEQIYKYVDAERADAVIMYTQDRTARDERVLEYLLFKDYLYERGLELHYSDTGLDPYTMEGNLVGYIKAHAASEERKKIKERTTRGKNAKAREGKLVMSGHPPYGYRRDGKGKSARMYVYEPEAQVVRKIFRWYTRGDNGNGPLSLRAIAIKLEETGEPTPEYRSNSAKYWIPTTIRGILTNEIYAGVTYYGKTRKVNKKRVKQPRENWIPIEVPDLALVDAETFEIVQKRAEKNRQRARRNSKHKYLLSSFFRCGGCNNAMTGTTSNTKNYPTLSYRCGSHWHKPGQEPCPNENKTVVTHFAESLVWEWFSGLMETDEKLTKGLHAMQQRSEAELEPKRRRLKSINGMIDVTDRKLKRLVNTLGDEEDEIVIATFRAEIKTVAKHKKALEDEQAQLKKDLTRQTISPMAEARIMQFAAKIRKKLVNPTYEQKRELFDLFNLQVVFRIDDSGRWLDVRCYLKPEGDVIVLYPSSETQHNQYVIIFSASLPLTVRCVN